MEPLRSSKDIPPQTGMLVQFVRNSITREPHKGGVARRLSSKGGVDAGMWDAGSYDILEMSPAPPSFAIDHGAASVAQAIVTCATMRGWSLDKAAAEMADALDKALVRAERTERKLAHASVQANYHANKVAIIEEERDTYKRDLDAELTGNAALRRDFGARDDETMCEFVARLARERDEARANVATLEEARERCAKCVPVFTQEFLRGLSEDAGDDSDAMKRDPVDDHEARIKELADKCDSLLGRVQLLEGKTRNLGGDGKWHVDSSLTKTGPARCKRCGGARKSFQVYCGAACAAEDGA